MRKLNWSDKAASDLEDIYDHIAVDSPFYASMQIERLLNSVERLLDFPESGRKLPEFPHLPYREVICGSYRVIYRHEPEGDRLLIVTVAHAARLITSIIAP